MRCHCARYSRAVVPPGFFELPFFLSNYVPIGPGFLFCELRFDKNSPSRDLRSHLFPLTGRGDGCLIETRLGWPLNQDNAAYAGAGDGTPADYSAVLALSKHPL